MSEKKGFTMIELLISVLLLTVLSGVVMGVLNSAGYQKKGRDAQRLSDLKRLQTALELYYADNRVYPSGTKSSVALTELASYITPLPDDPLSTLDYTYTAVGSGAGYTVKANMELETSNLKCQVQTCASELETYCCVFTNP